MDFQDNSSMDSDQRPDSGNTVESSQGRTVTLMPDAEGVVRLPAGVSLDDIRLRGQDLVIEGPDGTVYIIPNGATDVPMLVIDGVAVPPLNLAAYLIGEEPQPAAGNPQSSGGNFADPVDPIQAAYGLGDLLPYTDLSFPQPQDEEVLPQAIDRDPTITIVPAVGDIEGGTLVRESHLPADTRVRDGESPGSAFDGNPESTSGVISFLSEDGLGSILIAGVEVSLDTLPQTVVSDNIGTLVITAVTFDEGTGTGTVSYIYTLADNTGDPESTLVSFPLEVIDTDGDSATDNLVIEIVDDVPTAAPDVDSVAEGGTTSGNVLPNDEFGADGPAATTPGGGVVGVRAADGDTTSAVTTGTGTQIAGEYGTLVLNADGSYTYTANADIIDTDVVDVFVYTIRDGDPEGDQSTTTLTIDLAAVTLSGDDARVIVDEAALDPSIDGIDLAPADTTGRLPASTGESVAGAVAVAGATNYTLVGSPLGSHGQIALDADGTFVYTLTTRFDNLPHADDGTETQPAGDVFTYVATDANGNTVQGTITVDIIDDIPVASADVDTVAEGGATSGDVLVNDLFGADGPGATSPAGGVIGVRAAQGDTTTPVTTGAGTTIQGQFGTLVLNADGSYTYQSDADAVTANAEDVFVYTIEDGDGDRSTTTLTILVDDVTLAGVDARVTVAEAALDTLRDGADLAPGTVVGTSPASTAETVSGSVSVTGAGSYSLVGSASGTYGVISLNPDGTFTYTLTAPVDNLPHADDGNETLVSGEVFTYQATDANGNTVTGSIFVDIVDDVPIARADFDVVEEGGVATGTVRPNDDFGADGAGVSVPAGGILGVRAANGDTTTPVTTGVGASIDGEFGTLVLSPNGSYQYVADPDVPADSTDVFVYTIVDGDGDRSTTTLSIQVLDVTVPPPLIVDNDAIVDESGLDLIGSQIVPDGEFFTSGQITAAGAGGPFTFELTEPANGSFGTLNLNGATGAYSYTLTAPVDGATASNGRNIVTGAESFGYVVRDQGGNIVGSGTIDVSIVDDIPTAVANFNSVDEGGQVSGNVLSNDQGGADGVGSVVGVRPADGDTTTEVLGNAGVEIQGQHGTLTLNANGSYTYVSDQEVDANVQDVFVYTMVDGDGDRSTTTLTITVTNDLFPVAGTVTATLDDEALTNGIAGDNGDGSDASPDTSNLVGTLPGSGGDGALSFALSETGVVATGGAANLTYEKSGDDLLIKQDGVTVITVTLVASGANAGDYTITQNAALLHADGDTENNQSFTISYTVRDVDNDEATGTLTIDVDDDSPQVTRTTLPVPSLSVDETDLGSDDTAAFGGVFTLAFGADGAAAGGGTAWTLGTSGGATGLVDTATNTAVHAALEGGAIVGRADAGAGAVVFSITVNAAGTVTLDQQRAVVHTDTASDDESTPALASGLVTLTATATDRDGDSDSETLAIGDRFFFEDDGPAATDDSNTVPSGEVGPVTGNVLDNDDVGADARAPFAEGRVVKIASDNVPANEDDTPVAGSFEVAGEFGTLTIDEDGSYSYLRTDGTAGSGSDVFTYTMVDADGDPVTAQLVIGISDAFPVAGTVTATLDDEALTNGIAGDNGDGSDASPDTSNLVGTLPGSGGDGALSFALSETGVVATGGAANLTYEKSGDDLLIKQDGVTVITVTLVASGANAGDYTITQNAALLHADGDTENNQSFTISYTVRDVDNDEATGTLTIDVDDDSPQVTRTTLPVPSLSVDETDLGSDDTAAFGGVFTLAFGADGAAAGGGTAWTLGTSGGATGLVDTATNTAVHAALEGGAIVGRADAGAGAVVFSITVNAAGTVTLDQQRAVVHTDTASDDESTPALASGLVTLTATATDRDGDSDSETLAIGDRFFFEDDGPAATDDSNTVPSGEVGPVTGNVLDNDDVGADARAPFAEGRVVKIASDNVPANEDDTPVAGSFEVAGEFGTLTIDEDGSYSYLRTDGTAGSGSDVFTYTMVDADGDPVTAQLVIGISDAFPVAGTVTATLDDEALTNGIAGDNGDGSDASPDTSNLVGTLPGSGGDGALSFALSETGVVATGGAANLTYEKSGDDLLIKQDGVTVITVTLVASGANAGDYTITQNAALLHADGDTENNQSFTISYTVRDVDNDEATGTLTIDVDDDSPQVTRTTLPVPSLSVDETDLGSDDTAAFGGVFTLAFGADGAAAGGGTAWTLGTSGGATGLVDTATNTAVHAALEGGAIVGRADAGAGAVVFSITVNAAGTVTLDQQRAVVHTDTASDDESTPALASGLVTLTATATDRDGDSDSETLAIGDRFFFEDDGPAAGANAQVYLDDETASTTYGTANPGGAGDYTGTPAANTSGTLAHDFGEDGPGAVLLRGVTGVGTYNGAVQGAELSFAAEITGGGAGLNIYQVQNGIWVNVITVSVTAATGDYSVVQNNPVFHPTPGLTEEDQAFTIEYRVTDGDDDFADSNFVINVDDDTPELGAIPGDTVVNAANATGSGVFSYSPGADGHDSFGITGPALDGVSYSLTQNANGALLTATALGNTTIFTLQVNTAGTYEFTLVTPEAAVTESVSLLDLAPGNSPNFAETNDGRIEFSSPGSVNSSNQGFGVNNQFTENGESFTIEFHDPGTVGDQATTSDIAFVSALSLTVQQIVGSVGFQVTVYNDLLNTSEVVYVDQAVAVGQFAIDPVMSEFNRVTITGVSGSGNGARLTQLDVIRTILPSDVTLDFDVTATDGDGDTTTVSSFSIFVDAANPVALDLDGDGVEFLGHEAGVAFDYDGSGTAVATAWVGPDDGILVQDIGSDGVIASAAEFVFGGAGVTDMEALAARYGDTLDAGDADFTTFAVWRDANANGVSDAGEVVPLSDLGIVSIGLVSDGERYASANDDVLVHGEASYTRSDGTTGIVADASFATGQVRNEARAQEMAVNAIAAGIGMTILLAETEGSSGESAPLRLGIETPPAEPLAIDSLAADSLAPDAPASLAFDAAATQERGEAPAGSASSEEDGTDAGARLALIADDDAGADGAPFGDNSGDAGIDDGSGFLIAASISHEGAAMEQLLLLQGSDAEQQGEHAAIDGVMVDGDGEAFVDALVESLGTTDQVGSGDTDLAAILSGNIMMDHGLQLQGPDLAQTMEHMSASAAA